MSDNHDIPKHKWERVQAELDQTRRQSSEMAREAVLLRTALDKLKRGEFVCAKCGRRKNDEHAKGDF